MRRIFVAVPVLFSLFAILTLPTVARALQTPTVWVDAGGNVHSSPPEAQPASTQSQATPAYAASVCAPPALPRDAEAELAPGSMSEGKYLLWKDPAEGAFSTSLPAGWRISGGIVRSKPGEAHYVVRAKSPDGGVKLFLDDPRLEMPAVPGSSHAEPIPEPYRRGDQFAAQYVRQTLCPSATMMQASQIESQTHALNARLAPIAQAEGKKVRADVGDVSFNCGERVGYVYAITVQTSQPDGTKPTQAVGRLAGYLATPADSASAAAAIHKLLGTFQVDQAWLRNYATECGDPAGNMIRESNAITQSTID